MASCILRSTPTFSAMASDSRCHNWLYPERFGLGETGAGQPDMNPTPTPLPCKIEPDIPAPHNHQLDAFCIAGSTVKGKASSSDRKNAKRSHSELDVLLESNKLETEQCIRSVTGVPPPESTTPASASPPCTSPSKLPEPDHEVHIWTERERRKKMRSMFVTLHSMLPKVPSKADKSTIVDEAINYIKSLEQKMQRLLRKKAEKAKPGMSGFMDSKVLDSAHDIQTTQTQRAPDAAANNTINNNNSNNNNKSSFRSLSSSNIVFNICGSDAFITICANANRPNLLSRIFTCVIYTHKMDVKNVQITDASDNRRLLMIHACATDVTRTSEPDLRNVMQELMRCI